MFENQKRQIICHRIYDCFDCANKTKIQFMRMMTDSLLIFDCVCFVFLCVSITFCDCFGVCSLGCSPQYIL